jgi:hypothetical protein
VIAEPDPIRSRPVDHGASDHRHAARFLEHGGFGETLGNDVSQLARAVKPIASVLGAAREMEMLVVHTRMKCRSTSPTSRCRRRILAGVRQPHPTVWMSP